ncbi:helix-turn-helix domain-containing protein [Novosphingobium soli]|uniref:Helix-turn-helix domain-containing protein n=1 Tax=Novosphingobium soli TaxID=574956 RepID=A0ABV6CVW0_9SPHN
MLGNALQNLGTMTIAEQVVAALKRGLPSGRADVAEIARDMGMSERTLQRRITEEGTSFRDLLVEARKDLGRRLLSSETVQIDEVAYLLGYQDVTSFHRAFREWEGMSPGRWREHHASRSKAIE